MFSAMCKWSNHCLHHLLPRERDTGYDLKRRRHFYQLICYRFSSTRRRGVVFFFVCCMTHCNFVSICVSQMQINSLTYLLTYLLTKANVSDLAHFIVFSIIYTGPMTYEINDFIMFFWLLIDQPSYVCLYIWSAICMILSSVCLCVHLSVFSSVSLRQSVLWLNDTSYSKKCLNKWIRNAHQEHDFITFNFLHRSYPLKLSTF